MKFRTQLSQFKALPRKISSLRLQKNTKNRRTRVALSCGGFFAE